MTFNHWRPKMKIAARNTHTGTIMGWVDAPKARQAIAEGPAALKHLERSRQHFADAAASARHDRDRINSIYAAADRQANQRDYKSGLQFLADHECDLIGAVAVPTAVSRHEDMLGEAHRIEDRYVDEGETVDQAIEYYEHMAGTCYPTGAAYTYTLIQSWEGREIDDTPGYVLEDGRRFATAREAERADQQPARDAAAAAERREREAVLAERIAGGVADDDGRIKRGLLVSIERIGTVELTGRVSGRMVEVRFPSVPRRPPQFIGLAWFQG